MKVSLQWMTFQKTQWNESHIKHKIKVELYNVNLHMVYSLCNYGKTVNKLFVGRYISRDRNRK